MSRKRKNKLEEFYKKYKDIIDKFKTCEDKPDSEECKELGFTDILDIGIYEAFKGLQIAEKVKDIVSAVYSLAWAYEWNMSSQVRERIEDKLTWLKLYGLVSDFDIKHALMIAKAKRMKALLKNLPDRLISKYIILRLLDKLLNENEHYEEDGKLVVRIDRKKLIKLMTISDRDLVSISEYVSDNDKVLELYEKIVSSNGKGNGEHSSND